jgi:hypothetical protein
MCIFIRIYGHFVWKPPTYGAYSLENSFFPTSGPFYFKILLMKIQKSPQLKNQLLKSNRNFRSPNLCFWLAFILLNGTFFLPFYLFNRSDGRFFLLPGVDLYSIYDLFKS